MAKGHVYFQSVSERQLAAYFECTAKTVPLFIFPIGTGHHTGLNEPSGMEPILGRQAAAQKNIAAGMRYRSGSQGNINPACSKKRGMTVFQRCLCAVGREIVEKLSISST